MASASSAELRLEADPKPISSSLSKILQGALAAIARRGVRKLSMSDISEAAAVSRGTLYRHFATKEEVLDAVSEHVSLSFERGVVDAALAQSDPLEALRAVLRLHFSLSTEQQMVNVVEVDPEFVIGFLRDHFPRHVTAARTALAPVFDHMEALSGLQLDRELLAEAIIRVELSTVLVPASSEWNAIPDTFPDALGALLAAVSVFRSPAEPR